MDMNTKYKKKIRLGLIALGVVAGLLLIGFSILKWAILPSGKLTPLVTNKVNELIDGKLECKSVELTLFETFPHVGIALTNGRLISHVGADSLSYGNNEKPIAPDSLISFTKCIVSLRPLDYLFGGKITIGEITIEKPRINAYINKLGTGNWEIVKKDTASDESSTDILPLIEIKRINITDAKFTFKDQRKDIYCRIGGFSFASNGSLVKGATSFDIESRSSSILFESPGYTLTNHMSLRLTTQLRFSNNYNTVSLGNATLEVNNLPFTANGSVSASPDGESTKFDLNMGLKVSDLNDLIQFIPEAYLKNRDKIQARGEVVMEGSILGTLDNRQYPSVSLCCKINKGSYHQKGSKSGIDTLSLDVDFLMDGIHPDSSYVSMEDIQVRGLNTSLDMKGKITDLLGNPTVEANVKGNIDFTRLAGEFLNTDTLLLEGSIQSDIHVRFSSDDISSGQYGKIQSTGGLKIKNFKALSRPLGIDVFISSAALVMGEDLTESTRNDTVRNRMNKNPLQATLTIDSLQFKYKEEANTQISKLKLLARTTPQRDTSAVIPVGGTLEFDRLQTLLPDSVWVIARNSVLRGGMKASADDKKVPVARLTISLDSLSYLIPSIRTAVMLDKSSFSVEALPYKSVWKMRNDSASVRRNPSARRMASVGDSAARKSSGNSLLRKWEVRGNVTFEKMRLLSRLFPLPVEMNKSNVSFTTNTVKLDGAKLQAGKSDLTLSGELTSIRRAMLRGGTLKGNLSIVSDYIDCNELIQAVNAGVLYNEELKGNKHSSSQKENPEAFSEQIINKEIAASQTDTSSQLLIVPSYLDLALHTHAKEIVFNNLDLNDVDGKVVMRNQSIQLTNLSMHSNMGEGTLSMIYTAGNNREASTGFDLDVKQILVDKLISLFPSIDTLLPMLRAFEGVVDCQMAASCELDSTMSVKLPSLRATCSLQGENMVLLDGETFAEISKKLMFKNKKRNMIDSIAVDMVVRDKKLEVFPFLVQMDRYRLAVGGTQNLDMSFNYHVSVLKSPVPFKLGIDIKGTPDKYDYDITKCRYKDLFQPSKTNKLDSVKINMKKQIYESVRKQMNMLTDVTQQIQPAGNLAMKEVAEKPED